MPEFVKALKGAAGAVAELVFSGQSASQEDTQVQSSLGPRSHVTGPEPSTASLKRNLDPIDMETGSAKRRRESGGNLQRLDYPKGGVSNLAMPTSEYTTERRREPVANMSKGKVGGGRYKPNNTLGENKHKAPPTRYQLSTLPAKKAPLATTRSKGLNVTDQTRSPFFNDEDGFSQNPRSLKRPRTDRGFESSPPKNMAVDLTADEEPELRRGDGNKLHRRASSQSAGVYASRPSQDTFFDNHESRHTDQYTLEPKKKPRKNRPLGRGHENGTIKSPSCISIDDSESQLSAMKPTLSQQRSNSQSISRPDINLGANGVDKTTKDSFLRNRAVSIEDSNMAVTKDEDPISHSQERVNQRKAREQLRSLVRDTTQSTKSTSARASIDPPPRRVVPESRLNKKFTRDDETSAQQETPRIAKAKDRMKETSRRRSSEKVSDIESSDELAGSGNRIRSKPVGHVSVPRPDFATQRRDPLRESPSNIQPTRFTQSGRNNEQQPEEQYVTDLDADSVKIMAFYYSSCVRTGSDLSLKYDKTAKRVILYQGDDLQTLLQGGAAIALGEAESKNVYYSKSSNRVIVKGAKSTRSQGGEYAIVFHDFDGATWFMNALLSCTSLKFEQVDLDRMNGFFKTTTNITTQCYSKAVKEWEGKQTAMATGKADTRYELDSQADPEQVAARASRIEATSKYLASGPRRSTRQSLPSTKAADSSPPPPERWTEIHQPKRWNQPVVYPSKPGPRRATVEFKDLERLDEGEFLNDTLISFAMKWIEENMAPEHKDSVYFLNSFFYEALMKGGKGVKRGINYENVQRWTKNKDIFSVPFIVVPMNLNFHWFVAIICNLPNLARKPVDDNSDDDEKNAQSSDSNQKVTEDMQDLSIAEDAKPAIQRDIYTFGSDDKIEDATQSSPAPASPARGRKGKKKAAPPLRKYDTDQPVIITLDSLGNTRAPEVRNLKDYLIREAESKRGMALTRDQLQGITAKNIPEQSNFCDCGLYLVGYVEQFAKNPRKFINKVLSRESSLYDDLRGFSASEKRDDLREKLLDLDGQAEEQRTGNKRPAKVVTKPVAGTQSPSKVPDVTESAKPGPSADEESLAATEPQSADEEQSDGSSESAPSSDELEGANPAGDVMGQILSHGPSQSSQQGHGGADDDDASMTDEDQPEQEDPSQQWTIPESQHEESPEPRIKPYHMRDFGEDPKKY